MPQVHDPERTIDDAFGLLAVKSEDLIRLPWRVWRARFGGAIGPLVLIGAMGFMYVGKAIHDNSATEFAQAKRILSLAVVPLLVMVIQFIFLVVDIKCTKVISFVSKRAIDDL